MRSPGPRPFLLLSAAVLALAAAASGCEGSLGVGGTPFKGKTGQPQPPPSAEEQFAALEASFYEACGGCHDAGGLADTAFLAGPDRYMSALSWPGLVLRDWRRSLLLTHSVTGGGHKGTNLDTADLKGTLLPAISAWLATEAQDLPPPDPDGPPVLQPFVPILGFNAVYLNELGPDLAGVAITFNAKEVEGSLELTGLEVQPTKLRGVHVRHPEILVFQKASAVGDPDPGDTFAGVDRYYARSQSGPLGPGAATIAGWNAGLKLSFRFEVLAPYAGLGSANACLAPAEFLAGPAARFQASCAGCHAGMTPEAHDALDMSELETDPEATCAQIRNRINPANPPVSQIFLNSDPNNAAAHPFKFNGDVEAFDAFYAAVVGWVGAEAPPE